MVKYLAFDDAEKAWEYSAVEMSSRQDKKTRDDPATITRFWWGVSENEETKKASLEIRDTPEEMAKFSVEEQSRMKTAEQAEAGKEKEIPSQVSAK